MQIRRMALILLAAPFAETAGAGEGDIQKYWVCGIASYRSVVDGKSAEGQCRANTAYSEPPCRNFYLEYDGPEGVKPGVPLRLTAERGEQETIEIVQEGNEYRYSHTNENPAGDRWVYTGKCQYFEAPVGEKVYMDRGLRAGR